ncbi:hypothetical protein DMC01_08690 [Campylobacter troglodytis]|nr:hypothetical protein DMC01_08690 [Campylobacter troglodytis]
MLRVTRLVTASRRGFAKFRLTQFRGIKKENFMLHLKEIKRKNLRQYSHQNLLKLIRENPIEFNLA